MKFYLFSPESVPMNQVLFPTFIKTFEEKGHSFVNSIQDANIILLDLHTRIAEYNQSDITYLLKCDKPIVTWDEYDKGGMSNLDWPHPLTEQQLQIFNHIENNNVKSVHFCRLLNKTKQYPTNLYPYEKPILYEDPLCSADELFNREFDIVWIANTAPQREKLAKALREDGRLRCNIILGAEKIPHHNWIAEHRKGKFFISCSAGGYSNECVQGLFSISAQLRERNDQLLLHDFDHKNNCFKITSTPTQKELDDLVEIVNDKEKLYDIYKNGHGFVKTNYSEEAWANYYLSILHQEGIL